MGMRFLITLLLLVIVGCAPQETTVCADCNIILISIDTLRADHLGVYGYPKQTSPNIDRIAEKSYIFLNIRSESSWTAPGHASLLFSKYPHELNFYKHEPPGILDESEVSLAEVLKEKNYITQAFTGDGWVSKGIGFNQGFDQFNDSTGFGGKFDRFHEDALKWLSKNKDEKYFLFLHGYDVHWPYEPPDKYQSMFLENGEAQDLSGYCHFFSATGGKWPREEEQEFAISQYDAELYYVDELLGQLWEKLVELNQTEKTLIVITSDHGEEFFEHGGCEHTKTLYDELLHVPLIMYVPGGEGQKIAFPGQLVDIYPTILEILGIHLENDISGRSLAPLFISDEREIRPQISITQAYAVTKRAVTVDGWKLVETNPSWKPVPHTSSAHEPIVSEGETFIILRGGEGNQHNLFIDLDDFRQFTGSDIQFSITVRTGDKPAGLRTGFSERGLMESTTIPENNKITINSPIYTITPRDFRVRMVVAAAPGDTVLIDEFILTDLGSNQTLRHFVFDGNDKTYELYNLDEDPKELVNLVYTNKEMFNEMKEELDDAFKYYEPEESEEAPLREEVKEQLKSLGYLA